MLAFYDNLIKAVGIRGSGSRRGVRCKMQRNTFKIDASLSKGLSVRALVRPQVLNMQKAENACEVEEMSCSLKFVIHFDIRCKTCGKPIAPGTEYLLIEENKYHVTCFLCYLCKADMSREMYSKYNGNIICSK